MIGAIKRHFILHVGSNAMTDMILLKPCTYVIACNVKACLLAQNKRKDSVQFFLAQAQYVGYETDTAKFYILDG